jgi:hypothetical protein
MTSFSDGLWRVPKMTALKKKPLGLVAGGAKEMEQKSSEHISLRVTCQICMAISRLVRSNLIKTLILQRHADVLLICTGFVEEFGYGWN